MSTTTTPQGPVPAIGVPTSQDYPRLVFAAPYYTQVPLAELIEPAVLEATEALLPTLIPPYVDDAVEAAVQNTAVLLTGGTMTGPLYVSPTLPTQPSQAASMAYVDMMTATGQVPEVPPVPANEMWARQTGQWVPVAGQFLPIAGGQITGQLSVGGATTLNGQVTLGTYPNAATDAASKQYVDGQVAGALPISGGTVSGPLIYTATGGNTPRSAQNRAADVANVLDFGADPTGVADSAPAINAAASQMIARGDRRKSVYLPAGLYLVKSMITLTQGQMLCGDAAGNTTILVADNFDPAAPAIVQCTGSSVDPGPTIRHLYFWLLQPNDVTSRATFRTLANGGSSSLGGTGVQYPWVIAALPNSGRINIQHVYIAGGWNGIEANHTVYWIDDLRIGCFNINISIGGTAANPVLDWAHLSDIEVWTFGMPYTGQVNIFMDGNTVALQIGAQNGLVAQNISCFQSQVIFTADAADGWFDFTNLSMDADQATINMATCGWAHFANIYTTSGAASTRPLATFSGGRVSITNWYSHNSSPHPILEVTGGDVSVSNAHFLTYNTSAPAIDVSGTGRLRFSSSSLLPSTGSAYTAPLVQQGGSGVLQMSNVDMSAAAGSSGAAVLFNVDAVGNLLGNSISLGPNWNTGAAYGNPPKGNYGPVVVASQDHSSIQVGGNAFMSFGATAHNSTAFGFIALNQQANTAAGNTALGTQAGYGVTTGSSNTFVGYTAGYSAAGLTGANNTCLGASSGYALTTGGNNTLVGVYADQGTLTTGSNNIIVGENLGIPTAGTSNYLSIGNVLTATGINAPATSVTTVAGRTTFDNGSNWGAVVAATTQDLSNHIALHTAGYGFCVTAGRLNYNATGTALHGFISNGIDVLRASSSAIALPTLPTSTTYANDAAAAAGGVAVGQLYRNGSQVMVRVV